MKMREMKECRSYAGNMRYMTGINDYDENISRTMVVLGSYIRMIRGIITNSIFPVELESTS